MFLPVYNEPASARPTLPTTTNNTLFTPTSQPTAAQDPQTDREGNANISKILHHLVAPRAQPPPTTNPTSLIGSAADLPTMLTRHIIPRINVLEEYNHFLQDTVDQKDAEITLWRNRVTRRDAEIDRLKMQLEENKKDECELYGESEGGHPEDLEDLLWMQVDVRVDEGEESTENNEL
jgi:hypothetical protein